MTITLTGPNDFAWQSELDTLVAGFVAEYSDMALERLDGGEADFQKIYDVLTSLPFLTSKKMVVLKDPSGNKDFAEKAEELLKNLPETTYVIFVEPKFDKRSSLYKLLKKTTDFREFNELDINSLTNWLTNEAKKRGGNVSQVDARFLVERVGANQQLLASELDKFLLFDANITRQTITVMTEPAPQSTIFELLDAAFASDNKRTLELYAEQRALKVEPLAIIAMLAWQFHVLALIKTAGGRTAEQISSEAKLNPFVVRKSLSIARRLTLGELKKLVSALATLDVRLKSESLDADEALQYFLLNIAA